MTQQIEQQLLTGERALFQGHDLLINHSTFADGESPLKESRNIQLTNSIFKWKYPLWYSKHVRVDHSVLEEMARSGIWYTDDITVTDSTIQAPKNFRRSSNIHLQNVHMPDADETLWNSRNITIKNVNAEGNYFGMNSQNIKIDGFDLVGNYAFDGASNIEVHNATLLSKDAFWNCDNVTVYDSKIVGEYLGWNSHNLTFVNCTIESDQGLCYIDELKLTDCTLLNTDLAFEYCSHIDAQVNSTIDSVKNPISGRIHAKAIQQIIRDDTELNAADTVITTDEEHALDNAG